VVGLDQCASAVNCFYGPIWETYKTYGNTAPSLLGDCAFAAAADWEQIVLKVEPDETVVGYQFAEAGGTALGGIAQTAVWSYWEHYGIDGIVQTGLESFNLTPTNVENAVRDYTALIVELRFVANDYIARYNVSAGIHDVVVDGFTPEGPLVVSWGKTLQMTWEQWDDEAVGMWAISASL